VVEVAVATTRTVAHRTKELGVLGANGIPRKPVIAALLVEPVVAAVLGAVAGAVVAVIVTMVLGATGFVPTGVAVGGLLLGAVIAIGVSIVAAVATSILPTWTAASRPPIKSLSAGG
jgi:ABC-type antimicrobial peptide transport system permease subunit